MSIEDAPEAIKELKLDIRAGAPIQEALELACETYGLSELQIRNRFLRGHGFTIEDYARQAIEDVSIEGAISRARSKWIEWRPTRRLVGKRFYLDLTRIDRSGQHIKQPRRWFRYIGFTGYYVEAIDEETLAIERFDGGWPAWNDIHEQVGAREYIQKLDE